MPRRLLLLIGVLASLGAGSVHAQPSGLLLSADQVRGEFAGLGFEVAEAVHWTWSTPGLTTFRVRDASTQRLLMVLVYPDQATADTARVELERRAAPLVDGYGPSTWRANVAVVQASEVELRRIELSEYDREMEVIVRSGDDAAAPTASSTYAVDYDFLGVLDAALQRGNL